MSAKGRLARCALCDRRFGDDGVIHSREHIIPNSIGGQKKVYGILCKECNDRTGSEWDSVLAEQLSFLSSLLAIVRDDGKQPSIDIVTMSGKRLRKHADGRLTYRPEPPVETKTEDGVSISASVSTMEEARKLLEGYKRKYPKLDVESALKTLKTEKAYLPEPVKSPVFITGNAAGRSIVKSAFVMAFYACVAPECCELAKRYLTGDDGAFCWWFYYDREVVMNRAPGQIFHCVAVGGNPDTKQLIAYVELFAAFRMLVLLSTEYTGKKFSCSYAIDPTVGVERELSFDLGIPAEEVTSACQGGNKYVKGMISALNQLMPVALARSYEREREKVLKEAVSDALARMNVAPGERVTRAQATEATRLIMERLTHCIEHQVTALSTPIKPPEEPEKS